MTTHFFMLGFVMLFSAMLPGPDFAIVLKNTLLHSRKAGIYTSLGIGTAILIHMTYCVLGFAAIIRESTMIFHAVQYIGATYLAYMGSRLVFTKLFNTEKSETPEKIDYVHPELAKSISMKTAFRQGFICNLFNPKATLFFLTLFSLVITANTPFWINLVYAGEMFFIAVAWFCLLSCLLSYSSISSVLNKIRHSMERALGIGLIALAVCMIIF